MRVLAVDLERRARAMEARPGPLLGWKARDETPEADRRQLANWYAIDSALEEDPLGLLHLDLTPAQTVSHVDYKTTNGLSTSGGYMRRIRGQVIVSSDG